MASRPQDAVLRLDFHHHRGTLFPWERNTMGTPINYCLYARKSSESDERQTMSIDSQIKEMQALAERDGLNVAEVRQESHSAKSSGARPVFSKLLKDIREKQFNGILTWAPDRLSRNAGDLGSVVDLMDQGRLEEIRTPSQIFRNTPNEKFLLMILCSQAKLENDNKGVNVKRGLRAKCNMGIRPSKAPLGYLNVTKDKHIAEIIIDPERGKIVRHMFERVAERGHSGRTIQKWLNQIGFETKSGSKLALSKVYETLKNPFYYGEFEFGGEWYKGIHEPLITKDLFDKVQKQLVVPPKSWHKKRFPFKTLCICGTCKGGVTAEEKYKKLKYGGFNTYVYYHCARTVDYECDEPYITETDLIGQLIAHIDAGNVKIIKTKFAQKLLGDIQRFHKLRSQVLHQEYLSGNLTEIETSAVKETDEDMAKDYLKHTLQSGTADERREVLSMIRTKFILTNKELRVLR